MSLLKYNESLLPMMKSLLVIAAMQENLFGELREFAGLCNGCYFTWASPEGIIRRIVLTQAEQRITIRLTIWNQVGENKTWHLSPMWLEDLRMSSFLARIESAFVTFKHWNPWERKGIRNRLA